MALAYQLRPATKDDAALLAGFGRETFMATFGHLYPPEDKAHFIAERFSIVRTLADIDDKARTITLAFDQDGLAGFADSGPLGLPVKSPIEPNYELYRLYLDARAKGTGLAQRLLTDVIDLARTKGAAMFYLGVYHANERALAFYRHFGFSIIGQYYFPVGQTMDDERIMALPLA